MPWIDQNLCNGCGTCVEECPVGAITMLQEKASINMEECIRCGRCHQVCEQHASRHDSEKIPEEVENNLAWVKSLMTHYNTEKETQGFLKRIKRHFLKEIKVNEQTLDNIEKLIH